MPFALDGKKGFAVSAEPLLYVAPKLNAGVRLGITFYEQYRDYGEPFILPNSFFFTAALFNFSYGEGDGGINAITYQDGKALGGFFSLGAQYKLRFGEAQRFILGFGISVGLWVCNSTVELSAGGASETTEEKKLTPGMGVSGGMAFRFSPLVSLDLGLGIVAPMDSVVKREDHQLGSNTVSYHSGGAPLVDISLAARFWFLK